MLTTEKKSITPLRVFKGLPERYIATHKATKSVGKIIQVFHNADLRNGYVGLRQHALLHKLDVDQLNPGQYVVFLNSAKNKFRLYAAGGVVSTIPIPQGQQFNLAIVAEIPKAFNGTTKIEYDTLLKSAMEKLMERRERRKSLSPLDAARIISK